jgi:hypothetical protein
MEQGSYRTYSEAECVDRGGEEDGVEMRRKKPRRRPRRGGIKIGMGADFMIGDNI